MSKECPLCQRRELIRQEGDNENSYKYGIRDGKLIIHHPDIDHYDCAIPANFCFICGREIDPLKKFSSDDLFREVVTRASCLDDTFRFMILGKSDTLEIKPPEDQRPVEFDQIIVVRVRSDL